MAEVDITKAAMVSVVLSIMTMAFLNGYIMAWNASKEGRTINVAESASLFANAWTKSKLGIQTVENNTYDPRTRTLYSGSTNPTAFDIVGSALNQIGTLQMLFGFILLTPVTPYILGFVLTPFLADAGISPLRLFVELGLVLWQIANLIILYKFMTNYRGLSR